MMNIKSKGKYQQKKLKWRFRLTVLFTSSVNNNELSNNQRCALRNETISFNIQPPVRPHCVPTHAHNSPQIIRTHAHKHLSLRTYCPSHLSLFILIFPMRSEIHLFMLLKWFLPECFKINNAPQ